MEDLDRKLFNCHKEGPYSETEWQAILTHVIGKLQTFLGQPVVTENMEFAPHGFAGDIISPQPFAGLLQLSWFGRILAQVLGEKTDLSADLFLRGYGKRLVSNGIHKFLHLPYREQSPGQYGWSMHWCMDEYDEYESWE